MKDKFIVKTVEELEQFIKTHNDCEVYGTKELGCEREDFKNCGMYCACIACDIDGNGNEKGCPFKAEILEIEEDL